MALILLSPKLERVDPYKDLVSFLLKGVTPGNSNRTFLDSSASKKVVTGVGDATMGIDTDGSPATYLDGFGDRLVVSASNDFNLGATYTVEAEVVPESLAPANRWVRILLFGSNNSPTSVTLQFSWTGIVAWSIPYGGAYTSVASAPGTLLAGQKYRITACRSGDTARLYVNGQLVASGPLLAQTPSTPELYVGFDAAADNLVNGNFRGLIKTVHVVKGRDLYQGLTEINAPIEEVAETKLLLDFKNVGIVDVAKKRIFYTVPSLVASSAVMNGSEPSIYFNGASYGLLAYTEDFNFNLPSWTLETNLTLNSLGYQAFFSKDAYGINHDFSLVLLDYGNTLRIYTSRALVMYTMSLSAPLVIGRKYHIALSRANGTLRIFLDGVQIGITDMGFSNESNHSLMIGGFSYNNPNSFVNGYMSDIRFTKSVGRYMENFRPPTRPLTY